MNKLFLLEDFGSSLFGDRSVWKDVDDFIAFRSKFDQGEEKNTPDETKLQKWLIRWKTSKTGELSNNYEFHSLLQQLVKTRPFDHISHVSKDIKALYRGSSLRDDSHFINWVSSTRPRNWKNTQIGEYNMSVCSKLFRYKPMSLITSWTSDKTRANEFLDNARPILYICPQSKIHNDSFVFTGGDQYDNSFDLIAPDNAGEYENLGIAPAYETFIAIEEERVINYMNKGIIKRED